MHELLEDCKLYSVVDDFDLIPLDSLVFGFKRYVLPQAADLDKAYEEFLASLCGNNPELCAKLKAIPTEKREIGKQLVSAVCDLLNE